MSNPRYSLGIDTGGTFTDGVLLDQHTRQVVRTAKVLTSHHDLRQCIDGILTALQLEDAASIGLVSLSTTLATNAIAEGKRRPVALILMGYDAELVQQYDFQHQFGTDEYYYVPGRHNLNGIEQEALDESILRSAVESARGKVDAYAVASYAGPANASHEQRAAAIISEMTGLPVVQAHHLTSELDSIRRATTASLNASLLGSAQDFLSAVESMLHERGIDCPVMMMRGDGSVVTASYARQRPVEIIHSGPATSAIGGRFLAGVDTALVIDIGGTTTDIAIVEQGRIQAVENAATVGPYRTCVKTIKVRSIGLGGDSQIHFDRHSMSIGPQRVVPLAYLFQQHPQMRIELLSYISQKGEIRYSDRLEFWTLRREPSRPVGSVRTQKALEVLRQGPQLLPRLLKQVGAVSAMQLRADELLHQDIIERAGLTPTDLLHAIGEYNPWETETVTGIARGWGISLAEFVQRAKDEMTRRICAEVVQFLSGRTLSNPAIHFKGKHLDRWLFDESLNPQDPYLGSRISLKIPLVGIGAPAKVFLPPVAEALGTQMLLPEHFAVANAVGTVVGGVVVRKEGEVFPHIEGVAVSGYFARLDSSQGEFESYDEAVEYASQTLQHLALEEARQAGAQQPRVECRVHHGIPGMASVLVEAYGYPGGE
jgi:N-methylhydantoinase A/oxoprolinase/acetone carboxylase beta subunit